MFELSSEEIVALQGFAAVLIIFGFMIFNLAKNPEQRLKEDLAKQNKQV